MYLSSNNVYQDTNNRVLGKSKILTVLQIIALAVLSGFFVMALTNNAKAQVVQSCQDATEGEQAASCVEFMINLKVDGDNISQSIVAQDDKDGDEDDDDAAVTIDEATWFVWAKTSEQMNACATMSHGLDQDAGQTGIYKTGNWDALSSVATVTSHISDEHKAKFQAGTHEGPLYLCLQAKAKNHEDTNLFAYKEMQLIEEVSTETGSTTAVTDASGDGVGKVPDAGIETNILMTSLLLASIVISATLAKSWNYKRKQL